MTMIVKFVDAPSTSANVRLDLSQQNVHILNGSFEAGHPSFDGAPRSVGVNYGYRNPSFTVQVTGTETYAYGVLQSLSREVVRAQNWLLVQPSPMQQPVWFKTWQSEPGDLDISNAGAGIWQIDVPLAAEGFAYGARETLSAITINNDPAAGSNPCYAVLPTIKGDAPAPLRIEANPSNAAAMHGYNWLLSTHSGPTQRTPTVWQFGTSDGFTAGVDTAAAVADATFSGGSYRPVSFATDTDLETRLSGAGPTNLTPGKYKVLVRVWRSDTTSRFSLRLGQFVGLGYEYGATKTTARTTSTAVGHTTWVDLGEFMLPKYLAPLGESTGFVGATDIALQAGRIAGAGTARFDALLFIPLEVIDTLEARTLQTYFPVFGIDQGAGFGVWDGDREAFWAFSQFGVASASLAEMAGGFPCVVPGASNVLTVLQQVNGARPFYGNDASDSLAANTAVTASYHPRYLNLRGD